MEELQNMGWTPEFSQKWHAFDTEASKLLRPARVIADFGTSLKVALPHIVNAELSGKLAHYVKRHVQQDGKQDSDGLGVPKVGDWVAVRLLDNSPAVIEAVIPRHNEFARKAPGQRTVKQVIAANVDVAFVLVAMDAGFSVERLKRYLYQLSADAIEPVVVLSKADATDETNDFVDKLSDIRVPIIISSAVDGQGVDEILARIHPGRTAVFVGSSGVGKSTLTNLLLGQAAQETKAVRASDSAGRHTTVHRELFVLPNGGLLIDMPGIRELQLWGTQKTLDNNDNYDDVANLIAQCKYASCRHGFEAGCAIRPALQSGSLKAAHFANYKKMESELKQLKAKKHGLKQIANKRSYKQIKRQDAQSLNDIKNEMNESMDIEGNE